MTGLVLHRSTGYVVAPHCWIEIPQADAGTLVFDLRLLKYLCPYDDNDSIPDGLFCPSDFGDVVYRGDVDLRPRYAFRGESVTNRSTCALLWGGNI